MKVILADVMSLDGKLTKWDGTNVREWASTEDQVHLKDLIRSCDVMILGSGTFQAVRPKPSEDILRIVLTSMPARFAGLEMQGLLEFTAESPPAVIARLAHAGYKRVLLLGGSTVATAFLKDNLIDEIVVTIEPRIFGAGLPFAQSEPLDISLRLSSSHQLNGGGTILLSYTVQKPDTAQ